ncbi:MAG: hypothetical protein PVJ57_17125 [Phycisphaerae bacterium]|jgi:hypothetical protein
MAYARQCDRCRRVVAPRGNLNARYCPYCGAQLSGAPVEMPSSSGTTPDFAGAAAAVAVVCGVLSLLLPGVGVFPAIIAIGFGAQTVRRATSLPGQPGIGAGRAGVVLGIIGLVVQLLVCSRLA